MSEHTKGRLHQCSHSDKRLRDEGGEWVADTDTARRKQKECSANARRLAAAWNACEGMTTEAIEALAGIGSLGDLKASERGTLCARIRYLEALVAERDAMLGKRPCQNNRCNELNAARALLREALDTIEEFPDEDHEIADRIKVYLDACDKPGATT